MASSRSTNILSTRVYDLWGALNAAPGWTLGRTLPGSNPLQVSAIPMLASIGYSNYNGGFLSTRVMDWHGLTTTSNLTISRSLGTGGFTQAGTPSILDQWNLNAMYGAQPFDIRVVYNALMVYRPDFFRNTRGVAGQLLRGWSIAPLFTAQSGAAIARADQRWHGERTAAGQACCEDFRRGTGTWR